MLGQLNDSMLTEQQMLQDDQAGAVAESMEKARSGSQRLPCPTRLVFDQCHRHGAMLAPVCLSKLRCPSHREQQVQAHERVCDHEQ